MPRQPRLDAPGAVHHVMGRGIERTQVFQEAGDREDFVTRLAVQGLGYTGAGVVRFLGVTTSSVNRLAVSEELPEVKRYLRAL